MRRRLPKGVVAIVLLSACALAQSPMRTTGTVHGTVSIVDEHGVRSVTPVVQVSLTGPTNLTVQTDDEGNFSFHSVPPGYYAISTQSTEMAATRNIAVQAGTLSEVSLEMRLVVLAQSTTVTASADEVDPKRPRAATQSENPRRHAEH
jgi:carboxypeptidase family protein